MNSTETPEARGARARGPLRRLRETPRAAWRILISMRTALMLLFLLALGAIPGALLPQRSLNEQKVAEYLEKHGTVAEVFDRLQLFEVFDSTWFIAIYVLLAVSLVGCLTPRIAEHARALRTPPVRAPRNLARLPYHDEFTLPTDTGTGTDGVRDAVLHRLRGWRTEVREEPGGVVAISAERGYLREFGNLVFHFGLLVLLLAIAAGNLFHYEGQRVVIAGLQGRDADQSVLANGTVANYDSFRMGALVDEADLTRFRIDVRNFRADYLETGQAEMFTSDIRYQGPRELGTDTWHDFSLKVNDPLRIAGDRVYLQGHGFAPGFTVSFRDPATGEWRERKARAPFMPENGTTFLSSGVVRVDPPEGMYPDPRDRRKHQIAVQGLFAPTASFDGTLLDSRFPALTDPAVAVDVYLGDVGLDTGRSQNVYTLDQSLVETGLLVRKARVNLRPGEDTEIVDDGGVVVAKVRFDGADEFVNLQVSRDPGQTWVLVSSIVMIAGLVVSLAVRRRRVWMRLRPVDGRILVEAGGLARTDRAGWGEEFTRMCRDLAGRDKSGPGGTD